MASNSSRVWVESDPIGPDKERDLPAPASNSSVARIEKGEGMIQGSIGAGPAVSKPRIPMACLSSDCWWEKLMRRLADRLCDAMPAEHTSFLRSLKNSFAIQSVVSVHLSGLWRA